MRRLVWFTKSDEEWVVMRSMVWFGRGNGRDEENRYFFGARIGWRQFEVGVMLSEKS